VSEVRPSGDPVREARPSGDPVRTMPEGPWLLVVGMHRSGTSAVTGALGALGLAVPVAEDRPNAPESNPDHWESLGMGVHGDAVLDALGGTWDGPPTPEPGWEDQPAVAAGRVGDPGPVARTAFPQPGPLVWKDPRTCLLLPYWRDRLPGPLAAVVIWRPPLAVARSLARRDGMHLADGVALWERYNRAALEGVRGLDVFVTDYESVLADPRARLGEIAEWLGGLPQFAPVADRFDVDAAAGLVTGELRHHAADDDAGVLLGEQRCLLDHLAALRGVHSAIDAPAPGSESPWTTALLEDRRRSAERLLALQAERRVVEEQAAAHAHQLEAARAAHVATLAERDAELAARQAELDASRAETAAVRGDLAATRQALDNVRASTSWQLTRPLRAVGSAARQTRRRARPGPQRPPPS
jgi:hypothetical protein